MNRLSELMGMVVGRVAAARNRRRRMLAIRDLPKTALRDAGYTHDWRGKLAELPRGYLR